MSKRFASIIGSSIAVALAWLASLGTANAILVRGSIDPPFDLSATGIYAGLTDLYWTADIQFDVGSACLTSLASSGPGNCLVSGLNVTGRLSSISTPANFQDVTFFTSPGVDSYLLDLAVNSSGLVTGIANDASSATNVPFGYASANVPGGLFKGNAWVQFTLDGDAQLMVTLCRPLETPKIYFPDNSDEGCDVSTSCVASTDPTTGSKGAGFDRVAFTQVPESGSLWLILAALSAGWLTLRPRHRRG